MSIPPLAAREPKKDERALELTLRPQRWDEYVGQEHVKKNLAILIEAAAGRKEPIEHVLLSGPPGLGKTTLTHLISRTVNTNIRVTSGPAIERVGDLASILTNLLPADILFIDEVHRLNKLVEEVLYPAMESRTLDIIIGKGPSARTLQIELPPFTLIAATTRPGLMSSPLRSRFGVSFRLEFYSHDEMKKIIRRSAGILGVAMDEQAVERLGRSSRSTPRVANRLLKRMRDYAQIHGAGAVTDAIAQKTLELLEVDEMGLEPMDRKLLEIIIRQFNGGPVGLQTLAAASTEEEDSIEDVYEPYLMQLGLIERTPRGRVATERAYQHLGIKSTQQKSLIGEMN